LDEPYRFTEFCTDDLAVADFTEKAAPQGCAVTIEDD